MIHFKDNKNKSPLNTRWAQMTKQEQIIERKKMEIQAKLDAQKQAAALAAQAKLANPTTQDDKNIFSNDGSFMSQFKALLEKQKKDDKETDKGQEESHDQNDQDANEPSADEYKADYHDNERKRSGDRGSRDKHRRWNDRGRNRTHSPSTPIIDDRKKFHDNKNQPDIPSLMQISVRHPEDNESDQWRAGHSDSNSNQDSNEHFMGPNQVPPMGMPPGPMGMRMMGPGMMGSGPPGMGPNGPPNMGPNPMMGPGGPNMPPMPPFMGGPPNFPMPPNFMGPNGPRPCGPMPPNMCGPNGPMPPFFGPNGPMPPFPNPGMMGPNGPNSMGGPNAPNSMMGPNRHPMMGPNGPPNPMMGGPNGPPNPMMRPPLLGGPNCPPGMMGPNGPNSMNNGNMPFMGMRPPFGGPNFGNGNGPPNIPPFMPIPPNAMPNMPEVQSPEQTSLPGPPDMKQNIPKPLMNMPIPKDFELDDTPQQKSKVLSTDEFPAAVRAAASDVATNGDHWENVLKHITQDNSMWFLHEPNSHEYKKFRELVNKLRNEKKPEIKDEDKYEPEFSLEDDDSCDDNTNVKEEKYNHGNQESNYSWGQPKREHTSSQSEDEDSVKERRKRKKKSRWGTEPPADIKPPTVLSAMPPLPGNMPPLPGNMPPLPGNMPPMPGYMPPLPGNMPPLPGHMPPMPGNMPPLPGIMPPMPPMPGMMGGPKLGKIDEAGLKLSNVNRNNQALMQYAMTNYGTTNLSPEDWKKCEDNFKLNLLYQDMLKKRQEVERLNAAGKHKYEYDSDEDTSEGTWEHKIRAREMYATEKWADELTKQASGKHHIGDFLPPEELKKFMEKYSAVKCGKEPDFSDYKEFKLKEDNVGFKMLQKLGWSEGKGLGSEGSGIVDPINKANQPVANLGLGANTSDNVSPDDDEFDAYRKRMMLAYRFRPNPLNNPRRPYY